MKTIDIFSKKWIYVLSGVLFILTLSCTKDDLPSEDLSGIPIPKQTGPRDQPQLGDQPEPENQNYYYQSN